MRIRHPLLAAVLMLGLLGSSPAAPVGAVPPTDPCALLFVRELAESDDSPFAGEEIGASLETWLDMMGVLTEWPLESCEEPSTEAGVAGETSELACEWQFGPFRQHLVLRLVERGGERYAVRVRAMNERRLRHLVAIANS